jgi:hypothetical protein
MNKVNIIELMSYVLCLACCVGLLISVQMKAYNVVCAVFVFGSVMIALLYALKNRLEEAKNPLSVKNLKEPFLYIYENRVGTKKDFVEKFGENVYEYFLENTYIHQLAEFNEEKGDYCWESTKLGM